MRCGPRTLAPHRLAACSVAAALVASLAACSQPETRFSLANARAHVNILASAIGSRPAGTDANRRAREYVVEQLRLVGFDVRVQEADAVRPDAGHTARIANIIATKPGTQPGAIALVAHYDSVPDSPGGADDGLGVAVCLEVGRLLAARAQPAHTLAVLLTDGEELGLMGAAALLQDPFIEQVRAFLNVEAVGSAGPSLLFEAGPGSPWLVHAWAGHAPAPAGGSFATEIYKRLPNDTDFTVLAGAGIPGLNFAPTGDSYTYHTRLDTAERLSPATLLQTGANALAIVEALDRQDLTAVPGEGALYFDVGRTGAVAFGRAGGLFLAVCAVIAGSIGWLRLLVFGYRREGWLRLLASVPWGLAALAAACAGMVGASWLLREAREVYHPWYAHPDRYFVLLVLAGILGVGLVRRVRRRLPHGAHGAAGPAVVWFLALPCWIALAAAAERLVPAGAYLSTVPLLAAGVLLSTMPLAIPASVRIASVVVLAASGTLWIRLTVDTLHFAVPALGRMPFVTPVFLHPTLVLAAGLFVGPPLVAIIAGEVHKRWARRAWTAALLLALAAAGTAAYLAPAYTEQRPLPRAARYVADVVEGRAYWEIAGTEPGLDLPGRPPATEGWQVGHGQPSVSVPIGAIGPPFAFRARTTVLADSPVSVRGRLEVSAIEAHLEITVIPRTGGLQVAFGLPPGIVPLDANLPGTSRSGWWVAAYSAVPPEGITYRARFLADRAESLKQARVVTIAPGLPGGEGWQRLPTWLASHRAAWTARSVHLLPALP